MINRYKAVFPLPKEPTVTQVRNCIHYGGAPKGVSVETQGHLAGTYTPPPTASRPVLWEVFTLKRTGPPREARGSEPAHKLGPSGHLSLPGSHRPAPTWERGPRSVWCHHLTLDVEGSLKILLPMTGVLLGKIYITCCQGLSNKCSTSYTPWSNPRREGRKIHCAGMRKRWGR